MGAKGKTTDKVYYRVKQVDQDGKSTTSRIVTLSNSEKASDKVYVFPNPITNNGAFDFVYEGYGETKGDLDIHILDAHGRVVYSGVMPIVKGSNKKNISVSNLAAGTYFIQYLNTTFNIKGGIRIIKD